MSDKNIMISYDWEESLDLDLPDILLFKKILNKFYSFFITENYLEFFIDRDEIEYFLLIIEKYNQRELLDDVEKAKIDSLQFGIETIDARNEFSLSVSNKEKKIILIINTIKIFQITKNPDGITIEELHQYLKDLINIPISEITKYLNMINHEGIIYMPPIKKRYKFWRNIPSINQIKDEIPTLFFSQYKITTKI